MSEKNANICLRNMQIINIFRMQLTNPEFRGCVEKTIWIKSLSRNDSLVANLHSTISPDNSSQQITERYIYNKFQPMPKYNMLSIKSHSYITWSIRDWREKYVWYKSWMWSCLESRQIIVIWPNIWYIITILKNI